MITVTLYYYLVSHGDGSVGVKWFRHKDLRDSYQEAEENSDSFEGFNDAAGEVTFQVDPNGEIQPDTSKWSRWDNVHRSITETESSED